MPRRQGFTILELLVVIAIFTILIGILMPTLGRAREQARQIKCLANMRQITMAFIEYAHEHKDSFLNPDAPSGQAGLAASEDHSQVIPELYPYAHQTAVFHCPADDRDGMLSYSPNEYLGGKWPPYRHPYKNISQVTDTSEVFAFIEEFELHPRVANNSGGFVVNPPPITVWIDYPAMAHGHASCISFLDGHVECWSWVDQRTWKLSQGPQFPSTPANPDLLRLQTVLGGN